MDKNQVYSWRVSLETKMGLEREARREGITTAALLDRMAGEWLEARQDSAGPDAVEQARLHAQAAKTLGTISGGEPRRAQRARVAIRRRLTRRHGRSGNH